MCYITFRATKTGVTKLNVICVDDSRLTLFSLRRKIGCIVPEARVAACHNAKQAVDFARKNGCDVLLTELDIGGSETGGLDLPCVDRTESVESVNAFLKAETANLRYAVP